jgi:hypothetical protein
LKGDRNPSDRGVAQADEVDAFFQFARLVFENPGSAAVRRTGTRFIGSSKLLKTHDDKPGLKADLVTTLIDFDAAGPFEDCRAGRRITA